MLDDSSGFGSTTRSWCLPCREGGVMSPTLVEIPPRSIKRDHSVSLDQRMGLPQLHWLLPTCQDSFEIFDRFRDSLRSTADRGPFGTARRPVPCGDLARHSEAQPAK